MHVAGVSLRELVHGHRAQDSLAAVFRNLEHFWNLMRIAAEVRNPDSVGAKCEWPTKLNIILESAQQNPFGHLHHGVITRIHVAEKTKNPFFAKDLTEKGGAIDILLRQRRYLGHLHQEYSKMFEVPETAAKLVKNRLS